MESLAPKTQMLDGDVWTEMSDSGQLFVFDEISVFDRWTAHRHNEQAQLWNKVRSHKSYNVLSLKFSSLTDPLL